MSCQVKVASWVLCARQWHCKIACLSGAKCDPTRANTSSITTVWDACQDLQGAVLGRIANVMEKHTCLKSICHGTQPQFDKLRCCFALTVSAWFAAETFQQWHTVWLGKQTTDTTKCGPEILLVARSSSNPCTDGMAGLYTCMQLLQMPIC